MSKVYKTVTINFTNGSGREVSVQYADLTENQVNDLPSLKHLTSNGITFEIILD
tara:strand:- start:1017 stop:1178 length:162 start_codon:yes stop_codon:yes gene_type:complete